MMANNIKMDIWMFRPPVLVGERVVWLGSGSGLPQGGVVRWIGKLPEMGPDWTVGLELDKPLPFGGIDGTWGNRHLFTCQPKHGLIVPIAKTIRESDINWWPKDIAGKSLQHDKGSAELAPAVQSPPTFPRSKGVTKVTAPVRPFRRASPEDKPVTTPLPAARRRKLPPKEEPELETPVPTQQPKPAKRAGKHLRKIYPTVEEEEENLKPVERIVSKVQPQVKDPLLKTSPAIQYLIDKKCLDENFIQLLKQFELNFKDGIFSYSVQESSDQKLNVNSVQKVIKIAQEYQELKSKAVGITNLPSPDKDIEVVVNNIPLLSPVIKVPDSLKCSTEVTDIKVQDATKDNSKPRTFVPIARANTLTSCTSGDYSEYSWYDAKSDKTYEFMDCGSGFYETVEVVSGSVIGENGGESRGSKDTIVPEDSDEDSVDSDVHIERMNHVNNQNTNRYQDEGLVEDTTPVVDTVYPDQVRRRVKSGSYSIGEPTSPISSTSRKEKTSSGFFSFLRWFRKNKEGDDESEDVANREFEEGLSFPTAPSTPELLRSHSSSCGSVDTLFSTATATSFAFITPTCYRPFGGSNRPEKIIAVGPDTDTYRNRLRHRDRVRELDRNLTLRKKYRLFGSNTLLRSAPNTPNASPVLEKRSEVLRSNSESNDKLQPKQPNTSPGSQNSSFGKKKRKAPIPPVHPLSKLCDSLPNTLENKCKAKRKSMENDDASSLKRLYHRRTASESSKDKKSGAYCHVKGKRKAPPPPITFEQQNDISTLEKLQHQFSSIGKKKRPAPRPPVIDGQIKQEITVSKKESKEIQTINKEDYNKSLTGKLSSEEKERLIANIAKLKAHAERKSISASPPSSPSSMDLGLKSQYEQVVCNDSLKLERGVLKSNKDVPKLEIGAAENKVAPVSPRPWYKRNFTGRDSGGGGIKRDIFKSLEKKKDKSKEEDWIPEGGIPRVVGTSVPNDGGSIGSSRFSFFSRLDRSDEKKKEEKRKSQVSMLANISELDREAAEIVQKEQAKEQAMLAAQNAKFYSYPDEPRLKKLPIDDVDLALPVSSNVEVPKRSSARELISLFNSIGNVTKVTVNSTFFSKDGSSFFSKENGVEKRFSFVGESVKTEQRMVVEDCDNKSYEKKEIRQTRQSIIIDSNHSPISSPVTGRKNIKISESSSKVMSLFDTKGIPTSNGTASGVVIEEVDDEPENASKTRAMYEANKLRRHHSPSPSIPTIAEQSETASSAASTVKTNPGSNRSSVSILPDIATVKATTQPPNTIHVKQPTVWACPRCTLENQRWKLTCEACGRWRPSNTEELNEVTPTSNVTTEVTKETDINWESEIKKYFPNLDITANKTSQVNKKTDPKNDTKQVEEPTKICNGLPSTFIGGKLKQDMEKEKKSRDESVEPIKLNALINGGVAVFEEPDVDEVRKARLAFFNKTNTDGSQIDEISSEKTNEKIALDKLSLDENASDKGNEKLALNKLPFDKNSSAKANVKPGLNKLPLDENEQQKLREILKEMKNSLPKRPKKLVEKSDSINVETTENKVTVPYKTKENVKVEKSQKLGAIKKVPKKTYEDIKSASNQKDSPVSGVIKGKVPFQNRMVGEKAEALLITRKTVIEDIIVKKSGPQKTEKVSTSAQTNAVVRKVDSSQYSDQKKEGEFLNPTISAKNMSQISPDILPVTVEEYSTAIKDGVLYTSLSKDSKKIGTGTFELIRARDFANIEATKTGNEANVVHVYANITNPLMESSSPFQQSVVTSKQTPVIQIPRPVATAEKGLAAGRAEVKLVESSHGEVSKGSPQPSSSGITSPELSSTRDARGSSIQSSRVSESSSCSMASAGSGDNSEVEKLTAQLTLPKGLADFKANLEAEQKVEHNMNTLAINRLLRRLEAAIAGGQHMLAAGLAKDLARLKISCSVTRHRRSLDTSPASITLATDDREMEVHILCLLEPHIGSLYDCRVDMYVEDKVSHQGPIPLQVTPVLTVAQLKDKVEQEFEIPAGVQRWILGKLLASDDSKTLADHSISSGGCPIFLYLVAPDGDHEGEGPTAADPHPNPGSVTKQDLESKVESKDTPPGAKPGGGWYYNDDDERYSFCEDTESESSEEEDMPQPPKQNPIEPGTAMIAQIQQVTKVIKGQKEEEDSEELDDEDEEDSIEEETIPVVVVNDKPKVLVGPPSPTVPKFPLPGPSRQSTLVEQPDKPATSQTSSNSPTPSTSQTAVVLKPVTNQSPKPFRPARREAKVEKESTVAKAPVDKHPPVQPAKPAAPPEQPTGTLKLVGVCLLCTGWKCPVCTLVNSPTRPGCAACTTERPLKYVVPVEYRANDQELQRMQQEQQFDNELKQACWDIFKQ
uniref:(California timema) hypothetical protein n=1 Tax=Timema californicum TaxID=61474 RepID=A0A7R9J1U7_TIMCA|nr:unnamed protein product [Timema californicum]